MSYRLRLTVLGLLVLPVMVWAQATQPVTATQPSIGGTLDPDVIAAGDWSEVVDGISGRLILKDDIERKQTVPYLELRYTKAGTPKHIYLDVQQVKWELLDSHDKPVPRRSIGGGYSGPGPKKPAWVMLNFDCTLRTRLTEAGHGFPTAALNVNDPRSVWGIKPGETGDYSLRATFSTDPPKDSGQGNIWNGTLQLPAMKITMTGK